MDADPDSLRFPEFRAPLLVEVVSLDLLEDAFGVAAPKKLFIVFLSAIAQDLVFSSTGEKD